MVEDLEQLDSAAAAEPVEAEEYAPGELAPCIVTQARVWKPDDLKQAGLLDPLKSLLQSLPQDNDVARRFAILETWEARLQDRGHHHNVADAGGWAVAGAPGADKRNSIADLNDAGIFGVGIYPSQGDIATGVLQRGKVSVTFAPRRSKQPKDVAASEAANSYKFLWEKNNPTLQRDLVNLGWTDCRSIAWTRTVADKRFGLDDEGAPRKMEVTSAHGVLESKLPALQDALKDCSYAQIFCEEDYAVQRAAYTWMGKKIKPSGGTEGELEWERIARISTRVGTGGRLIGSTSANRDATMVYTWLRPGMFFGDDVKEDAKEGLLANFQNGVFIVSTGTEICAAWEESMDDKLSEGMWTRGVGQSRRALGTLDLPISKRVQQWAELADQFFRGAIPMTLLDSQAFDTEAVAGLEASPRRFFPVALDSGAGQTMQSVVGQTPAPSPQPGFTDLLQWYCGPLIQQLDGCTPALFGGSEGADNTVGASLIRLNQSLERYGPAWSTLNVMIAKACWQAAKACGDNQEADLEENIAEHGDICVNPQALRGGECTCTAETVGMIPESGAQREAKVSSLLELASQSQQVAQIISSPSNAREIVNALHLDDVITIDAADAEDGALEAIELLLEAEPLQNPAYVELEGQIQQAKALHDQAKQAVVQSGQMPTPDVIAKGKALDEQIQQLQQQLQSTPQYNPSVSVSTDGSEDYATCAATAFSWMQQSTGRSLRRKAERQSQGEKEWNAWTNVYLWWSAMKAQADKQSAAQPQAPKVSLTGKVSPAAVAQLLSAGGVQVDPQAEQQPSVEQVQRVYGPTSETETRVKAGSTK